MNIFESKCEYHKRVIRNIEKFIPVYMIYAALGGSNFGCEVTNLRFHNDFCYPSYNNPAVISDHHLE
jgi:hypothetical protein